MARGAAALLSMLCVLALFAAGNLHGVAAVPRTGADFRQWELEVPIPPLGNHEYRGVLLLTPCLQSQCSCRLISVLFSVILF